MTMFLFWLVLPTDISPVYIVLSFPVAVDYAFSTEIVTIPLSTGPQEFCFDIGIRDDDIVEPIEVFVLSFQIPAGADAEAGPSTTSSVSIIDNDGWFTMYAITVLDIYPKVEFRELINSDYCSNYSIT